MRFSLSPGAPPARADSDSIAPDTGTGASEAELRAWDMHQLECMRQLGQWKVETSPTSPALFCVEGAMHFSHDCIHFQFLNPLF